MTTSPSMVIARALTVLWGYCVGALLVANPAALTMVAPLELATISAGLLAPLLLVWVVTGIAVQRSILERRLSEFARHQEELGLQIRLMLNTTQGARHNVSAGNVLGKVSGDTIHVVEGEEVGPEFIHRGTEVVDDWVEVEFRNVGGPATGVIAITEGDTETRVDTTEVGSWKSVRVSLQAVAGTDEDFRFCLNFENARGGEQQQFFRYTGDTVVAIERPST